MDDNWINIDKQMIIPLLMEAVKKINELGEKVNALEELNASLSMKVINIGTRLEEITKLIHMFVEHIPKTYHFELK